jgi:hypothetical protein
MKRIFSVLVTAMSLFGAVAVPTAAATEDTLACRYRIYPSGHAYTPPGILVNGFAYSATFTIDIQIADDDTSCADRVRTAITIECERPLQSVPINCGFEGEATLNRYYPETPWVKTPIYIGSTGETGITSFYSAWTNHDCGNWGGLVSAFRLAFEGKWYTINRYWKMDPVDIVC